MDRRLPRGRFADALVRQLRRAGAYLLAPAERDKISALLFPGGRFDIRFVGKDATWIAAEAGIRYEAVSSPWPAGRPCINKDRGRAVAREVTAVETNFDGFEPLHLWETPPCEVHFVDSGDGLGGTGELGPKLHRPTLPHALVLNVAHRAAISAPCCKPSWVQHNSPTSQTASRRAKKTGAVSDPP